MANVDIQRRRRERFRASGVCVVCGGERDREDITQCSRCLDRNRDNRLYHLYGITRDEFNNLLKSQGFKCAICHKNLEERGKNTCVDHDHETGKVRGILCMLCNLWLGRYEQFKALDLMSKFDNYIERTSEAA